MGQYLIQKDTGKLSRGLASATHRPEVYYIQGSKDFAGGCYEAGRPYKLAPLASLHADTVDNMRLDLTAVALYLSTADWRRSNDGIVTFALVLAKPIGAPLDSNIRPRSLDRLEFVLPFRNAARGGLVSSIRCSPIFSNILVNEYLTLDGQAPCFSLELGLVRLRGSNSNVIIEFLSEVQKDPLIATGLSLNLIASGVSAFFEAIRAMFFSTDYGIVIWDRGQTRFRSASGTGYPLKLGRYLFVSTRLSTDQVEVQYRYLGGRLVNVTKNYREVTEADQLYLDIYAT
jgi:hypothetical protein